MNRYWWEYPAWLALFAMSFAISYGAALLHEPRSYWLWHDILGVI